jgi:hypothetical protein
MPLSRERMAGTTANLHVSDGPTPGQDGPNARTKLLQRAAGGTGPGPGDGDPTTYRSAAPATRAHGGMLEGELDIHCHARHQTLGPGNGSTDNRSGAWRQALGGSGCLSFMR